MPTPVGQDWARLPPLEQSRDPLTDVFDISLAPGDKYFVEAAGRTLRAGPWPIDAPRRAIRHGLTFPQIMDLFAPNARLQISLWDQLAADLPNDPDFRAWVRKAARNWLRYNDEYTLRDVTIA